MRGFNLLLSIHLKFNVSGLLMRSYEAKDNAWRVLLLNVLFMIRFQTD